MVFKVTITIEWNGWVQPLGSMVFRWFWGKTTIGNDGFRWLCTIGPTDGMVMYHHWSLSWCFVWHTWCFGWRNIFSDLWMAEDLLLHATSVEKMHPAETCRIPKIIDLYISNFLLASQLIRTWYFKIVVNISNNRTELNI